MIFEAVSWACQKIGACSAPIEPVVAQLGPLKINTGSAWTDIAGLVIVIFALGAVRKLFGD